MLSRGRHAKLPSTTKRNRGRATVEPTRIFEQPEGCGIRTNCWQRFRRDPAPPNAGTSADGDEATLPDDLLEIIRGGGKQGDDRSALFHSVVAQLKKRRWGIEAIIDLLKKYPNGVGENTASVCAKRWSAHTPRSRVRSSVPRLE